MSGLGNVIRIFDNGGFAVGTYILTNKHSEVGAARRSRGSRRGDRRCVRARYGEVSGADVSGSGEWRLSRRRRAHAQNAAGAVRGAGGRRCCRGDSAARPPVSRAPPTRVLFELRATTPPPHAGTYLSHVTLVFFALLRWPLERQP